MVSMSGLWWDESIGGKTASTWLRNSVQVTTSWAQQRKTRRRFLWKLQNFPYYAFPLLRSMMISSMWKYYSIMFECAMCLICSSHLITFGESMSSSSTLERIGWMELRVVESHSRCCCCFYRIRTMKEEHSSSSSSSRGDWMWKSGI